MTKEKKIKEEREITNLIFIYILKQQAFDYWLDMQEMTFSIYLITKVPQHRIRRYFYKNIYPNTEWLNHFEY